MLLGTLWLQLGGAARAHDFWLEPDPAPTGVPPAKVEERALHLRMGDGFQAEEEKPLQKEATARFDLYADRAGRRDLLAAGKEGQVPVAKLPPESSACLVVLDRKERENTMDAEKFNRYLAEEGQDAVVAQRAKLGQTQAEGRETYTRYLKALVPGTNPLSTLPNTFYKRRVGQRLEILLQNNPGRLATNRKLAVKVLFEGKPLPGVRVFAYRHETANPPATPQPAPAPANSGAPAKQTATTSAQGLADFKLDQNGEWLVRLVYIRPAEHKANATPIVNWESFWTSYSFVAKDAPAPAVSPGPKPIASPTVGAEKRD